MRKISNATIQPIVTYSQNREDIILASLFQDVNNGYYIDVGAANPDYLSVTKYFYTRGWSGINIEPSQRLYNLLKNNRARDKTFRYAISTGNNKTAYYREYLGDGLSTLSKKIKDENKSEKSVGVKYYRDYEVPVITLAELLAGQVLDTIHFMKVDVEGSEYEVLNSNDWSKVRPWVLCIEANHIDKDWRRLVEKEGYVKIYHDGLNDYYADKQHYDTLPVIDYNFIFNPKIVSPIWAKVVESQQREMRSLDMELTRANDELEDRPTKDGEGLRFRVVAKILLKKIDAVITGKLAPAPVSNLDKRVMDIPFTDTQTYDRSVWQLINQESTKNKPGLARRASFKLYRGVKKGVKSIVKMKGVR